MVRLERETNDLRARVAADRGPNSPAHEQSWGHATQKPVECMRRPKPTASPAKLTASAWSRPRETTCSPVKGSSASVSPNPLSYCCPATIFRDILAALFWPAPSGYRERDNRRMTDAAHNQHSETRRPSDHDRIVTTGPSRFQPAGSRSVALR